MNIPQRKCPRCSEAKPITEWSRNRTRKDGLGSMCRDCDRQRDAEARAKRMVENPLQRQPRKVPTTTITQLAAELARTQQELASYKKAVGNPNILVYRSPVWARSDAVSVGMASDWHVEEEVIAASVHGLNEYNLDIAKKRAEWFFKNWLRLTDIMGRETKIIEMFLAGLGDFFTGWIHEELMSSTALAPGDAARFVRGLLISGIEYLLRESQYTISGVLLPGNHGRITKQVYSSNPTGTSLESVMYDGVAKHFEGNKRVRLEVAAHAMVYRNFYERFSARLIHGYEVNYGGGIGGITIPVTKAISAWDLAKPASITLFGHFHQRIDGGNFVGNGSLIGYSAFSQRIKAKFEEAAQQFFLISARHGGEKSVTAPVWLNGDHAKG